jgi:uncharacterized protein (UPF0332 family)
MNPKFGYLETKVNLKKHIAKGHIVSCSVEKNEIAKLMRIAERDIREASQNCHETDWQFAIAYNAALQLASIALRVFGYRATTKVGHHWVTFAILPDILGDKFTEVAHYFNECRAKRNTSEYCEIGTISEAEAKKLIHEVIAFKKAIITWLKIHHPTFLS